MAEQPEAVAGNLIVLEQAIDALERVPDAVYAGLGQAPGQSPVGAHFRHVFDHYRAFLAGVEAGAIDYDARERGTAVEHDRTLALATARGFASAIARLPLDTLPRRLQVSVRSVAGEDDAPDWSGSTVKRELQFLVSHTVHHYALIKLLLEQVGVETAAGFGVAPSTLQARQRATACAR